jgi:hypothetical protein
MTLPALESDTNSPLCTYSINYYAPDIFSSIGITGTTGSLLASGVYGLVKIVATVLFMVFGVERAGRKKYFVFGCVCARSDQFESR